MISTQQQQQQHISSTKQHNGIIDICIHTLAVVCNGSLSSECILSTVCHI